MINQTPQQTLQPRRKLLVAAMVLCCIVAGFARTAESSEVSPATPAEYMIYQYPDVSLLIRIDAVGVEFESRIYDSDRALIKASHVPSRRIGPVYQFIDAVNTSRQLMIEVTPAHPTDRARIVLEMVQLPEDSRTSALQAEAFRLMSRAADSTSASDSSTWAMKTYTFKRAAEAFAMQGWEKLKLWNEYFVAHLVYHKLQDRLSAIELAQEVQVAARKAGFGVIELSALQLEGTALLAESDVSTGLSPAQKFTEAHRVFKLASELAEDLGFESEQALALFSDGAAWEQQENYQRALEQYRMALGFAIEAGDTELANRIRNSAAFAYETQGSISGAIEMLDQIADELSEKDASRELAQSLYEKGRILNKHYRFREASDALSEALSLLESVDSIDESAQSGLALGQAYYGMGLMDKAVRTLRESMLRLPATGHETELERALGILAAAYRYQHNFDAMNNARAEQEVFITTGVQRMEYLYERAQDSLSLPVPDISAARSLLIQSRQLAQASGNTLFAHRGLMSLCSEASGKSVVARECSRDNLRRSFDFLTAAGNPTIDLEVRVAWSGIHRREGRLEQAIEMMSDVVARMRYFRHVLPGVLGAWYWENRGRVFSEYMSMVLKQGFQGDNAAGDGRQALFALERLRTIVSADSGRNSASSRAASTEQSERIRSLLAIRESTLNETTVLPQPSIIVEVLNEGRENFYASNPDLELGNLNGLLGHLPAEAAVLTYYFSSDEVYAIVASRSRVQLFRLSEPGEIRYGLTELQKSLRNPATIEHSRLTSLGELMLAPFSDSLPELIYLMPGGPVNGIPFDLLVLDDRYLAEQHNILMLMSLSALEGTGSQVDISAIKQFFLAGNPDIKREVFNYDQEMSAEIRAITDIFVGPALHIVQGTALRRDEFQDERFEKADVIHLAIPGLVSLEFPQQSKLMLSGTLEHPGTEFLSPRDFQDRRFDASLAVLSSTRVHGSSVSSFNGYLGFVSDLLQSGVGSVVASLWLLEDADLANFMNVFYRNLSENPSIPLALLKTKRQILARPETQNFSVWAGFQVYID